jgi:RNA polymerase-binding transcription factor DksA
MTTIATRKAQLQARLDDLTQRLASIETELDTHDSKDWEELASERESDEVLEGMGNSGKQEIRMIEAALKRIEAGEYGFCVTCGAKIEQARLDVLPYTPFCSKCAP